MSLRALPPAQGLYDPAHERDACGVGFVCNIKNRKSHEIVQQGLEILERLTHRGAVGADPKAGDGAGILIQLPDAFFRAVVGFDLPAAGQYGVGHVFLPQEADARNEMQAIVIRHLTEGGHRVLGWRDVPVDNSVLGESVLPSEPVIRQVFVGCGGTCPDQDSFERKLFAIRKSMDNSDPRGRLREGRLLRDLHVLAHHHLQGHAAREPGRQLLPGPAGRALRVRPGPGAPALLHQHLSHLGPGAALPHDLPQRGDQYPARQRELDGGAPPHHEVGGIWGTIWTRSGP